MQASPKATTAAPIDQQNVISLIKQEHRDVQRKASEYSAEKDSDSKFTLAKQLIKLISVHSMCEEQVVYPEYRRCVKDGDKIADQSIKEHQELKETLYNLDQMNINDSAFNPTLDKALQDFNKHAFEHEEQDFLIRLEKSLSEHKLAAMAKSYREIAEISPTRPHPNAPTDPTLQKTAAAVTKPIDAIKDKIEGV